MVDAAGAAGELARLSWLEAATVRAYDAVEQRVTDEDLRQRLGGFRADHARHHARMHRLLERTGGAQEPSAEFIAFVRGELGVVQRAHDTDEALEQLLVLERANAAFFADALASGLPAEAERLVAEERDDERHHVAGVEIHSPHAGLRTGWSGPADA